MAEAVASAFHLDDLGVMERAVQNGCGGRDIVEELSPFFNGPELRSKCPATIDEAAMTVDDDCQV